MAHSAWIGDVARAKSTACRAWCYSEDFEISQFHAFYHHMSVYFGNLVKKKKADAEMYKIAIRIAICSEFQTDYIFDTDSLWIARYPF